MGRRLSVLFLLVVIVAFAVGWRFGLFSSADLQTALSLPGAGTAETGGAPPTTANGPATGGATTTPPAAAGVEPALPGAPGGESTADPATPDDEKPSFDVVRVEPDGSAVIAGRGRPDSTVALTDGTRRLGEAKAGANGEFVIDLTLPVGQHRLQLAHPDAADAQGDISNDAAVVNVPDRARPGDLLVMMERPGEASEILVRPSAAPSVVAAAEPSAASGTTNPASATPGTTASATGTAGDTVAAAPPPAGAGTPDDAATATAAVSPGTEPRVAAGPADEARRLSVEAVEIENGRLYIAGAADPRSTIRLYLDGQFVTETRGGEGERFIASALAGVAVGDHVIRADEIGPDGRVVARAEVPFNRPDTGSMSAVAAARPSAAPEMATPGTGTGSGVAAATGTPASGQAGAEGMAPSGAVASAIGPGSPSLPGGAVPDPSAIAAADPGATIPGDGTLRASVQAPLETVQARVIIRRGDSLWRISRATYGRGSRYSVIYLANGDQIRDPNRIYPGQVFRLPKDEGTGGAG